MSDEDEIVVHLPDFDPVDVDHFINSIYGWREHKDDIFITQLHKLLHFGTHWMEGSCNKAAVNVDQGRFDDFTTKDNDKAVEYFTVECRIDADIGGRAGQSSVNKRKFMKIYGKFRELLKKKMVIIKMQRKNKTNE